MNLRSWSVIRKKRKQKNMTITISEISLGIAWIAAGALFAWLFIRMMKANVNQLVPGQKPLSALLLVLGAFIRWVLMAVLLFYAVRMHLTYALIFILAFTMMRFISIIKLHRQVKSSFRSAGEG